MRKALYKLSNKQHVKKRKHKQSSVFRDITYIAVIRGVYNLHYRTDNWNREGARVLITFNIYIFCGVAACRVFLHVFL